MPCEEQAGRSREEQDAIVKAYQAKGREESVGWDDMESMATAVDDLDILDATLSQREDRLTIELACHTSDAWFGITVVGRVLTIEGTDGFPQGLEAVLALGRQYWESIENAS